METLEWQRRGAISQGLWASVNGLARGRRRVLGWWWGALVSGSGRANLS